MREILRKIPYPDVDKLDARKVSRFVSVSSLFVALLASLGGEWVSTGEWVSIYDGTLRLEQTPEVSGDVNCGNPILVEISPDEDLEVLSSPCPPDLDQPPTYHP